jgi:hypothetical protein
VSIPDESKAVKLRAEGFSQASGALVYLSTPKVKTVVECIVWPGFRVVVG